MFLSRLFPQYRFDYWDTDEGQLWAGRIWTLMAAERLGRALRTPEGA